MSIYLLSSLSRAIYSGRFADDESAIDYARENNYDEVYRFTNLDAADYERVYPNRRAKGLVDQWLTNLANRWEEGLLDDMPNLPGDVSIKMVIEEVKRRVN